MQGCLIVTEGRGYPLVITGSMNKYPQLNGTCHHLIYKVTCCVCMSVYDHWTQRKVTMDTEKSDKKKIRRP